MAVSVVTRPATEVDAQDLAPRLRPAEVAEVMAATGQEPLEALMDGVASGGEAWAVFFDGQLAFMWGVREVAGRVGAAWLLASDLVERYAKTFWKYCLSQLGGLLHRWDAVFNAIDVRHEQAIRWATRLGFHLSEPAPFGVAGLPFARFSVTRGGFECALRR